MDNQEPELLTPDNLKEIYGIAIYGDCGSGKTSLSYRIIENIKAKREVYFIKHPNPSLIKSLGYKNIVSLEQIQNISNCIVYFDEPQLTLSIYDKKANSIIAKACSLARQRNITLIISSSDSRVFTKHNESYFDLWLIKDLDYSMVKNGSKIKKAYKDNAIIDPEGLRLSKDQYISESRKLYEFNGIHKFKPISNWSDSLSKPYKISDYLKK